MLQTRKGGQLKEKTVWHCQPWLRFLSNGLAELSPTQQSEADHTPDGNPAADKAVGFSGGAVVLVYLRDQPQTIVRATTLR